MPAYCAFRSVRSCFPSNVFKRADYLVRDWVKIRISTAIGSEYFVCTLGVGSEWLALGALRLQRTGGMLLEAEEHSFQ
jgi:hypothetical protein